MLLVQLSDPHIVEEGELLLGRIDTATFLREAIEHVNRLDPQPDLVLLTGDLVNEGRPEEYEHLRELLEPLRAPFHLVPGNHDLTDELRDAFPDHVHGDGGRADGVIEGPLRIVTLDSSRYPEPGRLARSRAARVARPHAAARTRTSRPSSPSTTRPSPPASRTWTRWPSTPPRRPGWPP